MITRLPFVAVAAVAAVLGLAGCDSPKRTALALGDQISSYTKAPDPEAAAKIEQGFARLDKQIAELRDSGQFAEADIWQRERDSLQMQFAAATFAGNVQNVRKAAENIGQAFRQAGQAIGEALQTKPSDD